jgi:hypothetical protein
MTTVVVVPQLLAAVTGVHLLMAAVAVVPSLAAVVPLLVLRLLLVVVDNVDKLQVMGFRLSPPGRSGISVNCGRTRVSTSPVLLVKIWRAGGQLLLVVA